MDNIFSLKRFGLLLQKDFVFGYKITGLAILSALVMITLFAFSMVRGNENYAGFHHGVFPAAILLGGFIFASIIFNDLHTNDQRHVFLTLPASNLEKFLSKLFLSTLVFAAVVIFSYWLYSIIFNAFMNSQFGADFGAFRPFQNEDSLIAIKVFLVVQSVFLLGSVYFNKYAFVKTVGSLLALAFIVAGIGYLAGRIIFAEFFEGWSFRPHNVVPSATLESFMEGTFTKIVKFLFWYVLAPFIWVVAFFKLKEREA